MYHIYNVYIDMMENIALVNLGGNLLIRQNICILS